MGDTDCDCGSCDCDFGSCDCGSCDCGSCDCKSYDCGPCDCKSCDCGPCGFGSCNFFPDDGCGLFCCKTCDPDDCLHDACSFLCCCGEGDQQGHEDASDCSCCIKGFLCCIFDCLNEPSSSYPVYYSSNTTNINVSDISRNINDPNTAHSESRAKPPTPDDTGENPESAVVESQPS